MTNALKFLKTINHWNSENRALTPID